MAYAEAVARLEHNLNEGRGDAEAFFAAVATILAIGLIGVAILWRREANSAAGGEGAAAMLNDALRRQGKPYNAADVLNAIQSLDKTEQVKLYQHLAEAIQTGEH